MDNSGQGGKRIVFKKRMLASQALASEESAQQPEAPQEEAQEQVDYSHYYYQGEIFDQYYRPLGIEGGEAKLAEIASDPLAAPAPESRLDRQARQARGNEQQEIAEALANQIYTLAQKVRETDIDVYLSAFNVVLAEKSPREMKEILDRTNDFFTEHFYTLASGRMSTAGVVTANGQPRVVVNMGVEGSFSNNVPTAGTQITFNRWRVQHTNVACTGSYTYYTPNNVPQTFFAAAGDKVFETSDIGVGTFTGPLAGTTGPFLLASATPGASISPLPASRRRSVRAAVSAIAIPFES